MEASETSASPSACTTRDDFEAITFREITSLRSSREGSPLGYLPAL